MERGGGLFFCEAILLKKNETEAKGTQTRGEHILLGKNCARQGGMVGCGPKSKGHRVEAHQYTTANSGGKHA